MESEPASIQLLEKPSQAPSAEAPPQPPAEKAVWKTEEADRPVEAEFRRFLYHVPIISIIVGGALFLAEVAVIAMVLASPSTLGISDAVALKSEQRYLLGAVTIVMLVEAFLLGVIDTGVERRRIKILKAQRHLRQQYLNKLKESVHSPPGTEGTDGAVSPNRLVSLVVDNLKLSETDGRSNFEQLSEGVKDSVQEVAVLKQEVNKHTLHYIATLVFELASFLWKWALTLLVISNNWISVSVAIAGGIVYPVVVFWQKNLLPKRD